MPDKLGPLDSSALVCPYCRRENLIEDQGVVTCPLCGYRNRPSEWLRRWRNLSASSRRGIFLVTSILAVGLLLQAFVWKGYFLDVSWLRFKNYVGLSREADYIRWGGICNTLEDFDCARSMFQKVLDKNPSHRRALVNVGLAEARQGRYVEARPYFEAYFSQGGNAYDAIYWYAKTMTQLEGATRALHWFYLSYAVNPTFEASLVDVIRILQNNKLYFQALSVLGALNYIENGSDRWKPLFQEVRIKQVNSSELAEDKSFNAPSLDGQHFLIPLRFKEGGDIEFAQWIPKNKDVILPESIVKSLQLTAVGDEKASAPDSSASQKFSTYTAPYLQVGPWILRNIKVKSCAKCALEIGDDAIASIETNYWDRFKTKFITLKQKGASAPESTH